MIELNNVSYRYPGAGESGGVREVSLRVEAGEFVVLCGRSGCGKTTVTRLINGLIPHFYEGELEGEVTVGGLDIPREPLSRTAELIGSVFQNPKSQFFNVDTTSELAFGCENQGLPRETIRSRVDETAELLQLESLLGRSIFALSGGQKQQIACGSVCAAHPQVLVLDEPSSNLDAAAIRRLADSLKKLKAAGKTIVVSEHRLYYLMGLADRFLYLEDGRLTAAYTTAELSALPDRTRRAMGLRCLALEQAAPAARPVSVETSKTLRIQNLQCRRGKETVLNIPDLELPAGAVVAVIGANGAGKSTLAECLCGVLKCRGEFTVAGTPCKAARRTERAYMVMQDVNRQLFCDSVREEVTMGLPASAIPAAKAVVEQIGLGDCLETHPAALSGGQKQRVAIAAALCARKSILLYDEPTSGLDYNGMERMAELLREGAGPDVFTLVITHDLELIFRCCTHVLHLENGRVRDFYPLDREGTEAVRTFFIKGEEPMSNEEKRPGGLGRMLQLAATKKALMIPSVLLSILASAASFLPFLCIYASIREILSAWPDLTAASAEGIIRWGLLAFGGAAANIVLYFAALALSHLAAFGTLYELKLNFTEYLARLPLGFHLRYGSGRLRKITDENIEQVEGFIAHQLPDLAAAVTAPVVMILLLFAVDWRFGLVSLIGVISAFVVEMLAYGGPTAKTMMDKYQAALEDMNNASVEYVRGITVVKAFRQTVYSFNRLHDAIQNYTSFVIPYTLSWENYMSLYSTIVNNVYLFLIPVAVLAGLATPAEQYGPFASTVIFYLIFVPSISSVMMKVMYSSSSIMQIGSSVDRMDEVLSTPPLPEPEQPKTCSGGDIQFDHVSFSYEGSEEVQALKDVCFTAPQGSVTAVVGPSGGGKSTIAHLLPRFYDVTEGAVRIGGVDIRDIRTEQLMDLVSFVFQDVFLFKQSLMENIRLGRPGATDEEVIEASKAAQCHEFISALPDGYQTVYGRNGIYLSGGEQQRVAIARAIVKGAPILVLDEATAFSDPENEHLIQQALSRLMQGKTVLMIAHRLSTIRSAGQILVMEEGRLTERGTHDELLAQNGRYKTMWDTYTQALSWKMEREVSTGA